jgi:hypothetical protein
MRISSEKNPDVLLPKGPPRRAEVAWHVPFVAEVDVSDALRVATKVVAYSREASA